MAAESAKRKARPSARRRPKKETSRDPRRAKLAQDFYGSALDEAERIALEEARGVEGLDHEIALLRTRLRRLLAEKSEDVQLMLRGIDLLVKAVSARYRLSKQAEEDLAASLSRLIRGAGDQFMSEAYRDG